MNILVVTGQILIAIAALAVILFATIGGGLAAEEAHLDFLVGALSGAIGGLILAGTLFGAIANLFQIADSTAKAVRLLEKLEASPPHLRNASRNLTRPRRLIGNITDQALAPRRRISLAQLVIRHCCIPRSHVRPTHRMSPADPKPFKGARNPNDKLAQFPPHVFFLRSAPSP